jgi:spore germination protein YaaH
MLRRQRSSGTSARPARRPVRVVAGALAAMLGAGLLGVALPVTAEAADPAPRPIMSGWIPYWATSDGVDSLVANEDLFSDVSPFWYSAQQLSNGNLRIAQSVSSASKAYLLDNVRPTGVPILPAVTDGMAAREMAAVMASPTKRGQLVSQLVNVVVANGYDGIDLDFEKFAFSDGRSTWTTTRPAWVAFVKQLSSALHAQGKKLAVTTPPLYDADYDASSGYWVYDWAGIAPYIDRLRIMAYDYSVSGGNIAPFWWVEKVVAFAVTQVPASKVQLGIPAYGRNAVDSISGTCPTNVPSNYRSTLSFTAANAFTSIPQADYTSTFVNRSAAVRTWVDQDATGRSIRETRFTYQVRYKGTKADGTATECVVYRYGWYAGSSSTAFKARLVEKYRLAGLAQWTVGGEMSGQWSSLRSYARTIAQKPTSVAVDATDAAPIGGTTTVRARVVSGGAAVAGAKATLYAKPMGTSTWTAVASAATSSTGAVAFKQTLTRATDFRVRVSPAWERYSGSGDDSTRVQGTATVRGTTSISQGSTAKATVQTSPVQNGQEVRRQVWSSTKGWVTQDIRTTNSLGKVYFQWKPWTKKTYSYRFVVVGTTKVAGTTVKLALTVR